MKLYTEQYLREEVGHYKYYLYTTNIEWIISMLKGIILY